MAANEMVYPKISIIVPVYNGGGTLSRCLESLLKLDYPREKLEIIVVDNASTDSTPEIVKKFPVSNIKEQLKGRARARNAGIRIATGEFIAFIDADCIAHHKWIRNLLKRCQSPYLSGCCGEIHDSDHHSIFGRYIENRGFFSQRRLGNRGNKVTTLLLAANVMYPKTVLEDFGSFDGSFNSCEDAELSLRMFLNGAGFSYASDAIVYHDHRLGFAGLLKRFFERGRFCRIMKMKYVCYKDVLDMRCSSVLGEFFISNRKELCGPKRAGDMIFPFLDVAFRAAFGIGWLSFYLTKRPKVRLYGKGVFPEKVLMKMDEDLIISDLRGGCNYNLGSVGTRVYELLLSGIPEEDIITLFMDEYHVNPDEVGKDIRKFIVELKKESLINI